jgi:hypothetical protein
MSDREQLVMVVHDLTRQLNNTISELCLNTPGPEVVVNVRTIDRCHIGKRSPFPHIEVELLEVKKLE